MKKILSALLPAILGAFPSLAYASTEATPAATPTATPTTAATTVSALPETGFFGPTFLVLLVGIILLASPLLKKWAKVEG